MNPVEIVLIALGLAMDATAVSLVAAASGYANNPRAAFRLSFHFGLFQFLMPILGWALGRSVIEYISSLDHWVAFGLLTFVGARMIKSGTKPFEQRPRKDPSHGTTLILLSIATSIDALAIGLSLAMLDVNIWYPSIIIGFVTAALSLAAIQVGKRIGIIFGNRMEIIGGGILIAIGLRILISHFLV
ncbi:MAG: manganese efflux pump MntP family protein [Dehalococcoidia bacterium]